MAPVSQRPHRTVENGDGKEFQLYSSTKAPDDENWWSETCFLVKALSEGDLETFKRAVSIEKEGETVELITALGSVTNELYSRLECLGYTAPGDDELPENLRHVCVKHVFSMNGGALSSAFVDAQLLQMKRIGENRKLLNEFVAKFSGLQDLHEKLSLKLLSQLRHQFADTQNPTVVKPKSDMDTLYADYARRGVVKAIGPGQWQTTLPGALNVPFLLDIIRHKRSEREAA